MKLSFIFKLHHSQINFRSPIFNFPSPFFPFLSFLFLPSSPAFHFPPLLSLHFLVFPLSHFNSYSNLAWSLCLFDLNIHSIHKEYFSFLPLLSKSQLICNKCKTEVIKSSMQKFILKSCFQGIHSMNSSFIYSTWLFFYNHSWKCLSSKINI